MFDRYFSTNKFHHKYQLMPLRSAIKKHSFSGSLSVSPTEGCAYWWAVGMLGLQKPWICTQVLPSDPEAVLGNSFIFPVFLPVLMNEVWHWDSQQKDAGADSSRSCHRGCKVHPELWCTLFMCHRFTWSSMGYQRDDHTKRSQSRCHLAHSAYLLPATVSFSRDKYFLP